MEKVVRDGKVAVLVSSGYGAGWYSWHNSKKLLFHPKLVELVEQGRKGEITSELCCELAGEHVYDGGKDGLYIEWVPEGSLFKIDEYDGYETLKSREDDEWLSA